MSHMSMWEAPPQRKNKTVDLAGRGFTGNPPFPDARTPGPTRNADSPAVDAVRKARRFMAERNMGASMVAKEVQDTTPLIPLAYLTTEILVQTFSRAEASFGFSMAFGLDQLRSRTERIDLAHPRISGPNRYFNSAALKGLHSPILGLTFHEYRFIPMKALLVLILAAALGFVAYQYIYPPLADSLGWEKLKPQNEIVVVEAPKPKEVVVVAPKPKEEPKPEPKPEMAPPPAPMPVPEMPKVEPVKKDPNEFVAPTLRSIEEVTQNWAVIPPSVFGKQIMMKKDLELELKSSNATAKTKIAAGGSIFVVGQQGDELFVSTAPGSPMRALVHMDDTNIKEWMTDIYEKWKVTYIDSLRRAHEYKLAAAERAKNAPKTAAKAGGGGGGNAKPERDADGTYPMLIASMKAGEVTEIKPDIIKEWGDPVQETVEKKEYWTVNVKYTTETPFGKFDTEAQARIFGGRVEKWVYTGSGETVP